MVRAATAACTSSIAPAVPRTQVVPTDSESGAIDILDVQSPAFWSSPELMGAISPDDRWAPMMLSNDQPQFGLIDMTTGRFIALGANPPSGWWWSSDGQLRDLQREQHSEVVRHAAAHHDRGRARGHCRRRLRSETRGLTRRATERCGSEEG